jgi:two-component system phosphate regulon sensor histidine kinase PhoR
MKRRDKTREELLRQVEEMSRVIAELQVCKEDQESVAGELRQSEEKFRKLAEKSVVGIYLIQDDLLRYVNPKFAEIFGYEVDEMINRLEATAMVFPDDRPLVEENIRKRISGEVESIHFQFRGIRKDQGIVQVEVYGSRIDHQGRPAVLGMIMDITEQIRAQERLQESEERYRKLYEESKRREDLYLSFLNSSADAIMVYDLQEKAQYVSPSFTRLFGWTEEEVKGGEIPFVPESERDSETVLFGRVCGEGKAIRGFQTKRNAKDGSTLDVSISASCYHDYEGNPAGMSVILRDITALKSLERARRRAVDHLSHELRTPLVIIQASLLPLNRQDLPETQREQLIERIQRHLDRLGDLQTIVQRIVLPQKYQPEPLQVDSAIEGIIDDLRKKSAHRQVTLFTRLDAIETDIIDPSMLEQILRTLVKNAVENTPDGGEIIISLTQQPSGTLLQVQDHGVGITASDREFIFEAFYHTQETEQYSTRKPFDFNAGGKGLELMHLKILSEGGAFDISFESRRCYYLSTRLDQCCGNISSCPYIIDLEGCKKSGGTTFSVLFHRLHYQGDGQ